MEPQELRFCGTPDGVKIAYTVEGSGPPLIYLGLWTYSVNYPRNPQFTGLREALARERAVVGFDRRGIGLSQREIGELTLDLAVSDVEAVAADAGLTEFDLLGAYDGAHVAAAYCVRYPKSVRRLVLLGLCRTVGSVLPPLAGGLTEFINANWEAAVLAMAALALRNASGDALESLAAAYRHAISREAALKYLSFVASLDSTRMLPAISVPALVVHWRDDPAVPLDEAREAAALIPDTSFVVAEGPGPPWAGHESFLNPILTFLREAGEVGPPAELTEREAEILALLAAGRSNAEIARELLISARTVERHIGNVYLKIGAHNRAEATAFALQHKLVRPG